MVAFLLTISIGSILAAPISALAAPSSIRNETTDDSTAEALFTRGVRLFRKEDWSAAADLFEQAWEKAQRPSVAFNWALARHRQNDPSAAMAALEAYARVATSDDPLQSQAVKLRQLLLQQVSRVELAIAPPDADVDVDGVPRAGTGALRHFYVVPGTHVVHVHAAQYADTALKLTAEIGETARLEVRLAQLPLSVDTQPAYLTLETSPAGASLSIDGQQPTFAQNGRIVVSPGQHRLQLVAPGHEPHLRTLALQAGEHRLLHIELDRSAHTTGPNVGTAKNEGDTGSERRADNGRTAKLPTDGQPWTDSQIAAASVGSAGLVGLSISLVSSMFALNKFADSKDDCAGNKCGDQGTQDRNDARRFGTIATIAVGVGSTLLAGGVALWLLGDGADPAEDSASDSANAASATVQWSPWLSHQLLGLSLRARL